MQYLIFNIKLKFKHLKSILRIKFVTNKSKVLYFLSNESEQGMRMIFDDYSREHSLHTHTHKKKAKLKQYFTVEN